MSDQEAQADELLALASIYNEQEFQRDESEQSGKIHLSLALPPHFALRLKGQESTEHSVSFLPPLVLSFQLPLDYPSSQAPLFTLSSSWISRVQIASLCTRLDELWEENKGCVVLFTWIQFLKEETLDFIGIQPPLQILPRSGAPGGGVDWRDLDPRAVVDEDPHIDLLTTLLDFDEAQKQKAFDEKVFSCGICFSEKQGVHCLRFSECLHVYCKVCISDYFHIQIRDGQVQSLQCPEPDCRSAATPSQVKLVVDQEDFARYDRLLLQSSLDRMADVVYCPRASCCAAVMLEPDSTMGLCPLCRYAFCTLCKRSYHGLSHCTTTTDELHKLRDEYLSANEEGQSFLEKRFGKRVIQKAVEESFSTDWLQTNCKKCPNCGFNIQKLHGCNKMTCTSCHMAFCWICLERLSRLNPYGHFNSPQSLCYRLLFEGALMDDDEEDEGFEHEED